MRRIRLEEKKLKKERSKKYLKKLHFISFSYNFFLLFRICMKCIIESKPKPKPNASRPKAKLTDWIELNDWRSLSREQEDDDDDDDEQPRWRRSKHI